MAIVITTPVEVSVHFKKGQSFTIEEIFQLAQSIDEYEVEKEVSTILVVDIKSISSAGETRLLITPKENVTYAQLSEHLRKITKHILSYETFVDTDVELGEIVFHNEELGLPSEVVKEVESIKRMKEDIEVRTEDANNKLNESKKILDQILKLQSKG